VLKNDEESPAPNRPGEAEGPELEIPWAADVPLPDFRIDSEAAEGKILQCTDPNLGEIFAEVPCVDGSGVDRAVEAARLAWAMWRGTRLGDRSKRLQRLIQAIRDHAWEIADLVALEQGKPVMEALTLEVLPALDHLDYMMHHAEEVFYYERVQPRHVFYTHKQAHYLFKPLGLVAIVTPYSLPFALPMIQIASALIMGNAVLFKPSELTPLCGLKIGELCREAGFPEGLIGILPMKKEDSLYLVSQPEIDKVFVTGSQETGQQVMAMAGCIPKPVVLSLGSKNPTVVAGDADIERAARGVVWGAMANAGQHCYAIERVYVAESIASRFLERVQEKVAALRMGDPRDPETEIGPLISAWRRKHVHDQVTEAVERGGRLICGGAVPELPGFHYAPTVVLNPPGDCRLMQEETLGPVIPVTVVDDVERAILLSNESEYSLAASGWTTSKRRAERMMEGLEASVVTINDILYAFSEPAATKAGYRMSGHGHFHGVTGLREMVRRRYVSHDTGKLEGPLFSYPYDGEQKKMAERSLQLLHGGSLLRRFRSALRLLSLRRFRSRVPNHLYLIRSHKRRK
jgi:acyl-CoA reductase-like NAD-dependent aldehyde dehydrogenase